MPQSSSISDPNRSLDALWINAVTRTLLPLPFRVIADAASARACGTLIAALQPMPPDRTFDASLRHEIHTAIFAATGIDLTRRTFPTFAVSARTSATVKRHAFHADSQSSRAIGRLMITAPPRIAATGRSSLRMIDASSVAQGTTTVPKSAYRAEGIGRAPSGTHCQSRATAHDA